MSQLIDKIISGGNTGVDQAALLTAATLGIATGGWACADWCTEEGAAPWLESYGLRPCPRPGYPARTEANVRDSGGTLILTHELKLTGGTYTTLCCCESLDKPVCIALIMPVHKDFVPDHRTVTFITHTLTFPSGSRMDFKTWLAIHSIRVLNCAGPRESKSPGIFARASEVLMELLA